MLNADEQEIHGRVVRYVAELKNNDGPLLRALTDAAERKLHRKFNRTGLYRYAIDILKMDEGIARQYITVVNKCVDFPQVLTAVESNKFATAKAARFVSILKPDNVETFIEHATNLNYRDLDHQVAAINPKKRRSNHKPIDADRVRSSHDMPKDFPKKLKRLAHLLNKDESEALEYSVDLALNKLDPVKKAERAKPRISHQEPKELCVHGISIAKRKSLPAATKHAIHRRDQGQCTEIHEDGTRCQNKNWLHIHHIVAVEDGGTNELSNLTTLCSTHHEIRHQLEFQLGQKKRSNEFWRSTHPLRSVGRVSKA